MRNNPSGVDIHEISRQLNAIEEELIAVIPEELFVAHMLPIMAGDEGHNDLTPWNHLAGSPFNRVRVVSRSGDVLFTLPPMATSPTAEKDRDSRNSIYEMMETYKLHNKISPRMAQTYLDGRLSDYLAAPTFNYDDLKIVDDVLERYGRPRRMPRGFYDALERMKNGGDAGTSTDGAPDPSIVDDDIGDDF